mmetsp:Transcript_8268/g.33462  ORF Transcript_8268/g.33462 Transcript_8268/m.33462 type:complete len:391 (+) Transcript_8268:855-2027(+)
MYVSPAACVVSPAGGSHRTSAILALTVAPRLTATAARRSTSHSATSPSAYTTAAHSAREAPPGPDRTSAPRTARTGAARPVLSRSSAPLEGSQRQRPPALSPTSTPGPPASMHVGAWPAKPCGGGGARLSTTRPSRTPNTPSGTLTSPTAKANASSPSAQVPLGGGMPGGSQHTPATLRAMVRTSLGAPPVFPAPAPAAAAEALPSPMSHTSMPVVYSTTAYAPDAEGSTQRSAPPRSDAPAPCNGHARPDGRSKAVTSHLSPAAVHVTSRARPRKRAPREAPAPPASAPLLPALAAREWTRASRLAMGAMRSTESNSAPPADVATHASARAEGAPSDAALARASTSMHTAGAARACGHAMSTSGGRLASSATPSIPSPSTPLSSLPMAI